MTTRSQLVAIGRIGYFNGVLGLKRSPLQLAALFLTPISFVFFLRLVAQPQYFVYGVIGGALFTVLFAGNGMLNDCAYLRLERQLQQVFVASPVRPISYVLGMALSQLAYDAPALVLFLGLLAFVQPIPEGGFLALAGIVLLVWLWATSLGFLLSTFFRSQREIWPIATLVFSTLSILPPIFYPLAIIPEPYRWVAFLAPSTFGSQLASQAAGLGPTPAVTPAALGDPFVQAAVLVALTLLFALAAARLARWREP